MVFKNGAFKTTLELLKTVFNLTKDKLLENEYHFNHFREILRPESVENFKIDLLRVICNVIHMYKEA